MAPQPERVLALDVDQAIVRGMVVVNGSSAVAGGYAQLGFGEQGAAAGVAARIATALDGQTSLPVVVTCHPSLGEARRTEVVDAVQRAGFTSVISEARAAAEYRANPDGDAPTALVDADIAPGLLRSHAGLTLGDLAPVVGAGLGLLGLGADAGSEAPVAVWSPEVLPADPFASEGSNGGREAPTVVAGGAAEGEGVDDDLTIAAGEASGLVEAARSDDPAIEARIPDRVDGHAPASDVTAPASDVTASVSDVTADDEMTELAGAGGVGDEVTELPYEAVAAASTLGVEATDDTVLIDRLSAAVAAASAEQVREPDRDPPADPTPSIVIPATAVDIGPERSKKPILLAGAALVVAAVLGVGISQCGSGSGEQSEGQSTMSSTEGDTADGGATANAPEPTSPPAPTVEPTPAPAEPTAEPSADPAETASEAEPTAEPTAASAEAASEAEPTADPSSDPAEAASEAEPTAEPTTSSAESTATGEAEGSDEALEDLPPLSSLPERGAVFRPPTLFLEGPVQTQEQADALYEAAIAVVGPDNVVNNYVVRPDAPSAVDGNVRVEQAVLFETGSAVISEEFIPTLELGVAVMTLNPQVQMIVEGHTDSVGSDERNLVLSQRRAQAVVDYLVGRGVDPDRLDPIGRGESEPVASNETPEGRQINRRIEVDLLDLLTPAE